MLLFQIIVFSIKRTSSACLVLYRKGNNKSQLFLFQIPLLFYSNLIVCFYLKETIYSDYSGFNVVIVVIIACLQKLKYDLWKWTLVPANNKYDKCLFRLLSSVNSSITTMPPPKEFAWVRCNAIRLKWSKLLLICQTFL